MYKFSVGFHLISHRPSNDTLFALDTKISHLNYGMNIVYNLLRYFLPRDAL